MFRRDESGYVRVFTTDEKSLSLTTHVLSSDSLALCWNLNLVLPVHAERETERTKQTTVRLYGVRALSADVSDTYSGNGAQQNMADRLNAPESVT